jgi:hypothetical protein
MNTLMTRQQSIPNVFVHSAIALESIVFLINTDLKCNLRPSPSLLGIEVDCHEP